MRIVTYGAACSLDGFIAGPDGSYDWLTMTKDAGELMSAYWKTIDTLVMGRKTWEIVAQQQRGGSPSGIVTYVFSRTLREIRRKGVHLVNEDAGEFVRRLKEEPGKGICVFGGGDFARSLFAAGVIDEVGVSIQPLLLGAGIPMFLDAGRRVALELKENRTMQGGGVYVLYRVVR
jgi:dihydrofolate reductase